MVGICYWSPSIVDGFVVQLVVIMLFTGT